MNFAIASGRYLAAALILRAAALLSGSPGQHGVVRFQAVGTVPLPYVAAAPAALRPPDPVSTIYAVGDQDHAPSPVMRTPQPQLVSGPTCAVAPSRGQLKPFAGFEHLSLAQAAALGLRFAPGQRSADESQPLAVFAWRAGSAAECPARDGRGTVVYGSEWDIAFRLPAGLARRANRFSDITSGAVFRQSLAGMAYRVAGFRHGNGQPLEEALAGLQQATAQGMASAGEGAAVLKRLEAIDASAQAGAEAEDPPAVLGTRD